MKFDKERQGKVNTIICEIRGLILEEPPKDLELFLGYMGDILCQLDTDIAIAVMNEFGDEGRNVSHGIKVKYGY
jgi:hypothetical protein